MLAVYPCVLADSYTKFLPIDVGFDSRCVDGIICIVIDIRRLYILLSVACDAS